MGVISTAQSDDRDDFSLLFSLRFDCRYQIRFYSTTALTYPVSELRQYHWVTMIAGSFLLLLSTRSGQDQRECQSIPRWYDRE